MGFRRWVLGAGDGTSFNDGRGAPSERRVRLLPVPRVGHHAPQESDAITPRRC